MSEKITSLAVGEYDLSSIGDAEDANVEIREDRREDRVPIGLAAQVIDQVETGSVDTQAVLDDREARLVKGGSRSRRNGDTLGTGAVDGDDQRKDGGTLIEDRDPLRWEIVENKRLIDAQSPANHRGSGRLLGRKGEDICTRTKEIADDPFGDPLPVAGIVLEVKERHDHLVGRTDFEASLLAFTLEEELVTQEGISVDECLGDTGIAFVHVGRARAWHQEPIAMLQIRRYCREAWVLIGLGFGREYGTAKVLFDENPDPIKARLDRVIVGDDTGDLAKDMPSVRHVSHRWCV